MLVSIVQQYVARTEPLPRPSLHIKTWVEMKIRLHIDWTVHKETYWHRALNQRFLPSLSSECPAKSNCWWNNGTIRYFEQEQIIYSGTRKQGQRSCIGGPRPCFADQSIFSPVYRDQHEAVHGRQAADGHDQGSEVAHHAREEVFVCDDVGKDSGKDVWRHNQIRNGQIDNERVSNELCKNTEHAWSGFVTLWGYGVKPLLNRQT